MSASSTTPQLDRFLSDYLQSYEQLESLLVLRRDSTRDWNACEVAGALGLEPRIAEAALQHLAEAGVVHAQKSGQQASVRYRGPQEAFRSLADALAYAFEHNKVEVISAMNRHAVERLRTQALRAFADAFVIRRKDG